MFEFENHANYFHVKASGKLTHEDYVDHLIHYFILDILSWKVNDLSSVPRQYRKRYKICTTSNTNKARNSNTTRK